jgi:hypothetical protein
LPLGVYRVELWVHNTSYIVGVSGNDNSDTRVGLRKNGVSILHYSQNNTNKPNLRMMSIVRRNWITEKVHAKKFGRNTVIPQHPTSEWEPRYVLTPPQSLFVFRCNVQQLFHHYFWRRSNTTNTTLDTNGTQVQDRRLSSFKTLDNLCSRQSQLHCGWIMGIALWVYLETSTTATLASVSERLEPRFCSTNQDCKLRRCRWSLRSSGM